jgi:hypothetical protein
MSDMAEILMVYGYVLLLLHVGNETGYILVIMGHLLHHTSDRRFKSRRKTLRKQ